mmetsp:Transcript_101797/g.288176  ORF Transcript_101797/g.288176 Transcript_101797/m.288176 type:complete len:218 (+) Transcript_101797:683-1336(+)
MRVPLVSIAEVVAKGPLHDVEERNLDPIPGDVGQLHLRLAERPFERQHGLDQREVVVEPLVKVAHGRCRPQGVDKQRMFHNLRRLEGGGLREVLHGALLPPAPVHVLSRLHAAGPGREPDLVVRLVRLSPVVCVVALQLYVLKDAEVAANIIWLADEAVNLAGVVEGLGAPAHALHIPARVFEHICAVALAAVAREAGAAGRHVLKDLGGRPYEVPP